MPDFLVPDLGEGLEEATIARWLVAVGDEVALNEVLCVVETAKAEVEVPSPYAGTVLALGGAEQETLRVGTLLATIGAPDGRTPTLVGYGVDEAGDRSRRRRRAVTGAASGSGSTSPVTRPRAKPPVRKLARDLEVDLGAIAPGSGPDGLITRDDVRRAATGPSLPSRPDGGATVQPVRGVRARIAERMATSRSRIPDATCSVVADCTSLLEVRARLNVAAERAGREPLVTPFSLLCRLLVQALQGNPLLNATFVEEGPEIHVHHAVHLGVGTATDRGLVVPVVRDAGALSTLDLSAEIARLAIGARTGGLAPTELQGSTFTISNFGALGLDEGIPVINHPEAAILGTGSMKPRPHVVDGEVVVRTTSTLTLAFDHRVCDGAEAARFLTSLRDLVEAPELALLLA